MKTTPARSFTRLAVAIIIATVVISASALSYSSLEATVTKTATSIEVSTSTVTSVSTQTGYTTTATISSTASATTSNVTSLSTATIGNPIPVSAVQAGNYSLPGGTYVFDSSTNVMYVLDTSYLNVVNMSSLSVIAEVELPTNNTGGSINAGLTVDTGTNTIYVAVQGEVVAVNGSTNTIVRELPLSFGTLTFNQVTHKLWGTQPFRSALVEVDPQTGSVQANVSIGYSPYDIAVDPSTGLVYSDGCQQEGLVCDSWASIVNGTSGRIVSKTELGSADYPTMTLDTETHVLYVSGGQQLAAINGTDGDVIFNVNPQTCGPFTSMVVDPSTNLVYTSPNSYYYYLLAYDGATGKLVNMYSFPSSPAPVALNPDNGNLYLWTTSGRFLSIRLLSAQGNVNSTLLGNSQQCPVP